VVYYALASLSGKRPDIMMIGCLASRDVTAKEATCRSISLTQ